VGSEMCIRDSAIDVNSRFEIAPGIKDMAIVQPFIQALNNI